MSTLVRTSVHNPAFSGRGREVRYTAASLKKLHDRIAGGPDARAGRSPQPATAVVRALMDRVAERVERDLDDSDSTLFLISERMMAVERACGFAAADDHVWRLEDAPVEYRLLDLEWNAEVRRITSRVLRELVGSTAASDE